MHSLRAHSQYTPSGVGTLMDPEFLRHAWHDGDVVRPAEPDDAQRSADAASLPATLLDRCAHVWRATFG